MTREMGSLGRDVAAAVAERLRKQVVHHEFIGPLADKLRLRKSHVIRLLYGKAGIWERLTADKTSLSIYTADETFSLAEKQEVAVIHGWGAAHLLRPVPHVISVRVCAPFEVRVRRMMERLHTDDREFVEHEITRSDETYGAITRRHFGINWHVAEQYDLVLNTERLTIKECSDEVMDLVDDPEFQETRDSMRLFSDLALAAHVRASAVAPASGHLLNAPARPPRVASPIPLSRPLSPSLTPAPLPSGEGRLEIPFSSWEKGMG